MNLVAIALVAVGSIIGWGFVTNTFAGANATSYGIDISVGSDGLKIASDVANSNLITSATLNYNWIQDSSS